MERKINLDEVRIELLDRGEDTRLANELMEEFHYLGSKRMGGEQMRYVATYRGSWIALLFFEHATLHSAVRDKAIGWTLKQRQERLKFIAKNARFLIFPQIEKTMNLGSKILSLVEKRISNDYLKRYNHPLLAMETYVDPAMGFEGSCYKGAGWVNLGMSAGYEYSKGNKSSKKLYFIKPLHKDAFASLRGEFTSPLENGTRPVRGTSNNYVFDPNKVDLPSLRKALEAVPDPRKPKGKRHRVKVYEFLPTLTLCVVAALSGNTQYTQIQDWIKNLSDKQRWDAGLRRGRIPSYSRIQTILNSLDEEKFENALNGWLAEYSETLAGKKIYLDGKVQRGTGSTQSKQHKFLNVFIGDLGIVIRQEPIINNSEQAAAHKALKELPLDNSLVMLDALHTSAKTAELVKKKLPTSTSLSRTIIRSLES